jgi:hypothetical protein
MPYNQISIGLLSSGLVCIVFGSTVLAACAVVAAGLFAVAGAVTGAEKTKDRSEPTLPAMQPNAERPNN